MSKEELLSTLSESESIESKRLEKIYWVKG